MKLKALGPRQPHHYNISTSQIILSITLPAYSPHTYCAEVNLVLSPDTAESIH